MNLEICTDGAQAAFELADGVVTLGGSDQDGIRVDGAPPAVLELRVEGERLVVMAREVVSVGGVLCPRGVPRLVLAGERVELGSGLSLRQPPVPPGAQNTAAVAKSLLGGAEGKDAACAALTCLTGLDVGRRFVLCGEAVEVGRGDRAQVRIRDRAVSRQHARVRRTELGYQIEDLGSPNGVYVNGARIHGATVLPDGAIIELGHSLLRFTEPLPQSARPRPVRRPLLPPLRARASRIAARIREQARLELGRVRGSRRLCALRRRAMELLLLALAMGLAALGGFALVGLLSR